MGSIPFNTYLFAVPLPLLVAAWLAFLVRGRDLRNLAAWFALIYSTGACAAGTWGTLHPDTSVTPPTIGQAWVILIILFAFIAFWSSRIWSRRKVYPESIITLLAALLAAVSAIWITY